VKKPQLAFKTITTTVETVVTVTVPFTTTEEVTNCEKDCFVTTVAKVIETTTVVQTNVETTIVVPEETVQAAVTEAAAPATTTEAVAQFTGAAGINKPIVHLVAGAVVFAVLV